MIEFIFSFIKLITINKHITDLLMHKSYLVLKY